MRVRARDLRESRLMEQLDCDLLYRKFVRPPPAVYFRSADRSPNVSASARATRHSAKRRLCHVTQGAVAVAVATNALAVHSRTESKLQPHNALGNRCVRAYVTLSAMLKEFDAYSLVEFTNSRPKMSAI